MVTMKRLLTFVVAAAGLLGLSTACDNISEVNDLREAASLTISVSQGEIATKADPSTTALDYESKVNKLDYFIFEGGTTLYYHETVNSPTFSGGSFSKTFQKLPVGTYTVAIIANGTADMAALKTISAVKGAAVTLAECSRTVGTGFTMFAMRESISLVKGNNDLSNNPFQLERFPARVRLLSVANTIPSSAAYANNNSVKVLGIFLCRVNSAWTLDASGNPSAIVNPTEGSGAVQSIPNNQPAFVPTIPGYATQTSWFPSAITIANGATNSSINWDTYAFKTAASAKPKLEILAEVNGENWYYPVLLPDGLDRNKTYEVIVTISGTGTKDITVDKIERANVTAIVTVKDWQTGAQYTENI